MKLKQGFITSSNILGKFLAVMSIMVAAYSANTACFLFAHQPKLPDSAKKLRKF